MDLQPTTTQAISDDQELAKVLAGVSKESDDAMQFEETPAPSIIGAAAPAAVELPTPPPIPAAVTLPTLPVIPIPTVSSDDGGLDSIKKDALTELRPLVDKLNLSPEEKFDTYLLLIRSTDDKTLIAPAYETAKSIADETRRAQALLDVIKEIDFLAPPVQ